MDNIIAKKFNFQLDAKLVKALRDKSFICYNTDDIELLIDIVENGAEKILDNSMVEVIYSYPNGESNQIKQTMEDGDISIVENKILIRPKSNCLIPTEYLKIDINIYDEDEFISTQPFIFRVYKSAESEMFEVAEDVVNTMRSIDGQLQELSAKIDGLQGEFKEEYDAVKEKYDEVYSDMIDLSREISSNTRTLEGKINEVMGKANTDITDLISNTNNRIDELVEVSDAKLQTVIENSNNEVNALMEKINNTNIELDECFLRSTNLTPIDNSGRLLFTTELLLTSPTNLVNKSYILTTSCSPYVSTVVTSNIEMLYFSLEGDNVTINYISLANKSVQGNSISVVPQFNNGKSTIPKDSSDYKIYILTNILTSYVDNATCTITSNTTLSNNI